MSFKFRKKKSDYIPSKFEYDLSPELVEEIDVVAWLAQLVYPSDTNTVARNKVRTNMRNDDKFQNQEILNAPEFFSWAVTKKKWRGKLLSIRNVPYEPLRFSSTSSIGIELSSDFLKLPSEPAELQNLCAQQHFELLEKQKMIKQLENEKTNLKKELQVFLDKKEELRLKHSEGGRKGHINRKNNF